MKFFILALLFFITMLFIFAFTIFLYIRLVLAVKNNQDVPDWMYKLGHAFHKRGTDQYEDFTDKSVLNDVNSYILEIIIASIAVYFILYKNYTGNGIAFWIWTEFLIIVFIRPVIILGTLILSFIFPLFKKTKYSYRYSAAGNAVEAMMVTSILVCMLTVMLTGIPEKAPVVQVGNSKIIVGSTTANELLSKGFTFSGKNPGDIIENKRRNSHAYFSNKVELLRNGEVYGYVDLTPAYKDRDRLEDCIITYFGISSNNKTLEEVKIGDKNISELSSAYLEKNNMRDALALSPFNYIEHKSKGHYSLIMQNCPLILWKNYKIEMSFFNDDRPSQFEVYAEHTLWR